MSIQAGESTGELNTWGAAHVPLWDAIRAKGRQVRVVAIAAEHEPIERADRVLRAWAAAPEKDGTGMSVKQEIAAIKDGMLRCDHEFLEQWGGWHPARERWFELEKLPEANLGKGLRLTSVRRTGQPDRSGADPKGNAVYEGKGGVVVSGRGNGPEGNLSAIPVP